MRRSRSIALSLIALIAIVLGALLAIPLFFGDRIASRVKTEVNRSVNARVAWDAATLSLVRDFPNASLTLHRLVVAGVQPFDGDTLLRVRQARLVLDLGSVMSYLTRGASIVVREMAFQEPSLRLRTLANGARNWNIARGQTSTASGTTRTVAITLRDLSIGDGTVTLDDQQTHVAASLTGLQESLHGDFARERFLLATRTRADTVSVSFGGIPYLNRVRLELRADVDADLHAHRFTLTNDSLRLNKLLLTLAGTITTGASEPRLNLTFSAPSTAFAEILSLVPAVYSRDFEHLQTAGTMSVSGRVLGPYGAHAFPAFVLRARVENGSFRYPELPLPARDISLDLAVHNPGGSPDSTVVELTRLHATLGDRPIDAHLIVRTPVSDPDVDMRLTAVVNLADLRRTVKLQGATELSGLVAADVAMRARVSDVDRHNYERVAASGTMSAAHVALMSNALPHAIAIDTAALRFTPRAAELTAFTGKIGTSDMRATGSLDNLLGFLLHDEDLRGTATVSSNRFVLSEWRSKEKTSEVIPIRPRIDFTLKASAAHVTYGALSAANVHGGLEIKNQRVTLTDMHMEMLRGSMTATGFYETSKAEHPTFGADFQLLSVDIPEAFTAMGTVQALAPIARWAQGNVSGRVTLGGLLGRDMTPVYTALAGSGTVETERLVLKRAPILEKLANALSLDALRSPGIGAVRASFDVADGRVHVKPFGVKVNGVDMTVSGSHGMDQTLKYDLALALPRVALGAAAMSAVSKLALLADKPASAIDSGQVLLLRAQVLGTVANPTISTNFAGVVASAREAAQSIAREVADAGATAVKQKADSVAGAAVSRARAEAERLVTAAERQADTIRATARGLADKIRAEANARIDSLLTRATNLIARLAAQKAADKLRREAGDQADRVVREADARADDIVAQAKQKASALVPPPADSPR